jgi:hypothetical protein
MAPELVKKAIEKKLQKNYGDPSKIHLLIYLNINAYDVDIEELRKHCLDYSSSFGSIWILTGRYLGTLFITDEYRDALGFMDGFSQIEDE